MDVDMDDALFIADTAVRDEFDVIPEVAGALAAEVRRLRGIGATGQCEVTEEWTQLPHTDVEIRLRPPMRSGYVGYRQRWPSTTDGSA
jgi:hypothetical protein